MCEATNQRILYKFHIIQILFENDKTWASKAPLTNDLKVIKIVTRE